MDSSISREKCVQCAWFLYTFLPVLFYFSIPLLPFPRCNFPLSVSKNPPRKKKEKKKKRIVSLSKNFDRFFSPLPHFDNFDTGANFHSFFLLVLSFDTRKLASINSRTESIIPSGIWFVLLIGGGGRKMGAQSLTEMPVLFVQPTLNEICTVYSLSRGKWR